jgi:peptidoglycan-N-acetylglucosamine deacetylase
VPVPAETFIEYTVQAGDSLYTIAQKYGVPFESILTDNNISNPNLISTGQKIKIRVNIITAQSALTPTPSSTP